MAGFTQGEGKKCETNSSSEISFWRLEVRSLPHDHANPLWPHLLFIVQQSLLLLQALEIGILKHTITEITGLLGPLKLILHKSAVPSINTYRLQTRGFP